MMPHFDQSAFEKLRDKVLADIAGAMGAFMAFIGDQTGVYKALEPGTMPSRGVGDPCRRGPALPPRMALLERGERICRLPPRGRNLQPVGRAGGGLRRRG